MAWGWPFLLRLAAAHRRRQPRRAPPGTTSGLMDTPSLASLPSTGVRPTFRDTSTDFPCVYLSMQVIRASAKWQNIAALLGATVTNKPQVHLLH